MSSQRGAVAAILYASLSLASSVRADDMPPPAGKPRLDVSACAKVTASARYEGYGYTHIVELKNACEKPVECQVWTNVDRDKVTLRAKPGEGATVITRKGSPSRDVTAESECKVAP